MTSHAGGDAEARRTEDAEAARLVRRVQAGDREAFACLYSLYFDRVYAYLRVLLRSPEEAEDVAQQVFLQVFEALPTYQHRRSFWVWLFVVVRNQALKELRNHGRTEPTDPEAVARRTDRILAGGDADLFAIGWITDADILTFIEQLPIPQRQVLALRYMLDLPNEQIAAILDRTASDVRLLHHRAVKYLKARLISIGREPRDRQWSRWDRRTPQARVIRSRRWALDSRIN